MACPSDNHGKAVGAAAAGGRRPPERHALDPLPDRLDGRLGWLALPWDAAGGPWPFPWRCRMSSGLNTGFRTPSCPVWSVMRLQRSNRSPDRLLGA